MDTYIYTYLYTYTHTYTHIHIHIHIPIHICTYLYTYAHTYTHIHIPIHIYTYLYTYAHTYTHMHILSKSKRHDMILWNMLDPRLDHSAKNRNSWIIDKVCMGYTNERNSDFLKTYGSFKIKSFFLIWEISYRINNQYIEYCTLKWVNIFKLVCFKVQFLFYRYYVIIRSNYTTNSCKYTYIIKWYNYRE